MFLSFLKNKMNKLVEDDHNLLTNGNETEYTNKIVPSTKIESSSINLPLPEWETLIKDQGGLGRFQIFSFIIITLQTNSVGWIIYNLGLMTM